MIVYGINSSILSPNLDAWVEARRNVFLVAVLKLISGSLPLGYHRFGEALREHSTQFGKPVRFYGNAAASAQFNVGLFGAAEQALC